MRHAGEHRHRRIEGQALGVKPHVDDDTHRAHERPLELHETLFVGVIPELRHHLLGVEAPPFGEDAGRYCLTHERRMKARERVLQVMPRIRFVHRGVDHVAVIVLAQHLLLLGRRHGWIDRRDEEDSLRAGVEGRRRIVRGGDGAPLERGCLHHLTVVARRKRHDVLVDQKFSRACDLAGVRGNELGGRGVIRLHSRGHLGPVGGGGIDAARDVVHLRLGRLHQVLTTREKLIGRLVQKVALAEQPPEELRSGRVLSGRARQHVTFEKARVALVRPLGAAEHAVDARFFRRERRLEKRALLLEEGGRAVRLLDPDLRPHAWRIAERRLRGEELRRDLLHPSEHIACAVSRRRVVASGHEEERVQWTRVVVGLTLERPALTLRANVCRERALEQRKIGQARARSTRRRELLLQRREQLLFADEATFET